MCTRPSSGARRALSDRHDHCESHACGSTDDHRRSSRSVGQTGSDPTTRPLPDRRPSQAARRSISSVGAGRGAQHLADWEDWVLLTSAAVEAGCRWGPVSRRRVLRSTLSWRPGIEVFFGHDADRMEGSLRSTPPIIRRRGDGAQRGGTENVVVDGSSAAVGFWPSFGATGPESAHDWPFCSMG